MDAIQFSGKAGVIFSVEHDLIRGSSGGVVSGRFDGEHILLSSVPATDQMPSEIVSRIIGIGSIVEDKIESDFDDVDKSITTRSQP